MKFNSKLCTLRKSLGLSRPDLAKTIGISKMQLGRYEDGTSQPTASVIMRLAEALECTTDYLLNDKYDFLLNHEILDVTLTSVHNLSFEKRLEIFNYIKIQKNT